MSATRRLALSVLIVGSIAWIAGQATYARFAVTTADGGNSLAAGTVAISDNDAGGAVVTLTNALPGNLALGCITVTYDGSLDSQVHLYGSVSGALAPYLNLKITRGTNGSSFSSCAGFTADGTNYIGQGAGVVYNGDLSAFPSTYAAGIVDAPGSAETWTSGESHAYQVQVTFKTGSVGADGLAASATFTWEARNL